MPTDKPFTVDNVVDAVNRYLHGEDIVGLLNEIAEKFYQPIIDNLNEQINDAHHF